MVDDSDCQVALAHYGLCSGVLEEEHTAVDNKKELCARPEFYDEQIPDTVIQLNSYIRDITHLDPLTNPSVSFICGGKTFNKPFGNLGEKYLLFFKVAI